MIRRIIEIGIRLCGLSLLLTGMAAATFTLQEAWDLYDHPELINRFAMQIEKDTGLDEQLSRALYGVVEKHNEKSAVVEGSTTTEPDSGGADSPDEIRSDIRLSYFISWIIVIMVLSLLIRVSLAMAHTGSRILLYDLRGQGGTDEENGS